MKRTMKSEAVLVRKAVRGPESDTIYNELENSEALQRVTVAGYKTVRGWRETSSIALASKHIGEN